MADKKALRLLIQASGAEAQQLTAGALTVQGVSFRVERLFKNRPPETFGLTGSEWFLAVSEQAEENPWDSAHSGVMNGFGMGLAPGFSYAEPDLEQEWLTPHTTAEGMAALAAAPPCQFRPGDAFWPAAPSFTWFLDPGFSQLRDGRNAVDHRHIRIGHIDTGYSEHVVKPRNLNTALGWNFVENNADTHDPGIEGTLNQPGHGTGTLGILAGGTLQGLTQGNQNTNEDLGGAPNAEIVSVRVANSVLHFFTSALAQAFDYVIAPRGDASKRCDVVSLSMGGVPSKVWAEAVNRAYEAGVCIVAASGNNFGGIVRSVVYPARFGRVIAACGITADGSPYHRLGAFSHMGGNFGPASKMKTAIAACTPNIPWADRSCRQLVHADGAGTSSATPQVAASAALWLAKHNPQYDQPWKRIEAVRNALFTAGDKHFKNSEEFFGNGAVRANAALAILPLASPVKTPVDSVFLPILKEVFGIGIAPAQEDMFHVEACQLLLTSESLNGILEDPDVPVKDDAKVKQFLDALIAEPKTSKTLRHHLEGAYIQRFKTTPSGVSPTPPSTFPPEKQQMPAPKVRSLRGYAFDPSLSGSLATATINEMTFQVRWEKDLQPGPVGEYLEVIDYDSSARFSYPPIDLNHKYVLANSGLDPSEGNPQFHQQMVYAVCMSTIETFERALGRPVQWAAREDSEHNPVFVPRLQVHPHAMEERNAFYSPSLRALLFGYFRATADDPLNQFPGSMTFSCLSHDIVAHETTHAILDGMHRRFGSAPTNSDMLAFHEAFADVVAIFQHFTFPEVVKSEIGKTGADLTAAGLLTGLAQQFGRATGMRGALRRSIGTEPDATDLQKTMEPHARGAILLVTIFEAFVAIYNLRAADLLRIANAGKATSAGLPAELVNRLAAEAGRAARQVLDICIRALDYCPPVDLTFGDYLRALVTADYDLVPSDRLGYRLAFLEAFRRRGVYPLDVPTLSVESLRWQTAHGAEPAGARKIVQILRQFAEKCAYGASRRSLFKTTWETREKLKGVVTEILREASDRSALAQTFGLDTQEGGDSIEVDALRIAQRMRSDGAAVPQAIVEITQRRNMPLDPEKPEFGTFEFFGGCTLIIDLKESRLDYVVAKHLDAPKRAERTRAYLKNRGSLGMGLAEYAGREPFALLHQVPEGN